jgi:hypothetical protein
MNGDSVNMNSGSYVVTVVPVAGASRLLPCCAPLKMWTGMLVRSMQETH